MAEQAKGRTSRPALSTTAHLATFLSCARVCSGSEGQGDIQLERFTGRLSGPFESAWFEHSVETVEQELEQAEEKS